VVTLIIFVVVLSIAFLIAHAVVEGTSSSAGTNIGIAAGPSKRRLITLTGYSGCPS
jgi:hypothetical protein